MTQQPASPPPPQPPLQGPGGVPYLPPLPKWPPHAATWTAVGLSVLAMLVAMTARVLDYQMVIMFGGAAALAVVVALVVNGVHRNMRLLAVTLAAGALAALVLVLGFSAMNEYQRIFEDLGRIGK